MKKGFWKGFSSGMTLAILIVVLCVSAAATSMRSIQVEDGIGITLNGATFVPQDVNGTEVSVFLYNGTTYVPVRAICEAMGLDVSFDSVTRTVKLSAGEKRWQKEVDGRKITYLCEEEGHSYSAPPAFQLTWDKDGWGLTSVSHDARNYKSTWEYRGSDGDFILNCAYPSSGGFSREMNNADAVENGQTLVIQGNAADYYDDGENKLLVWENPDGVLFYMLGSDMSKELMVEAAESIEPCSETVENYSLGWKPSGYSMMESYQIADSSEEFWVKDGVAFSWMYSRSPLRVPDWSSITVEINGAEGSYWEAQEPYVNNSEPSNGFTTYHVPGESRMNTLAWQDPETGVYFRLQSILNKDTMLRMAESVK